MNLQKLICVIDQRCSIQGHDTAKLLEGFGLTEGENFWITGTQNSIEQFWRGEVGKRMVDTNQLLVFISVYHGGMDFARRYAERIKKENPNARIIFRCVCAEDHNPDPAVFNGWMHTGDDDAFCDEIQCFLDPTRGPILQGKLIITKLRMTRLGGHKCEIGEVEINETQVRSCSVEPDSMVAKVLAEAKNDGNTISVILVRENFSVGYLYWRPV